jgi:hypothetical protein
VPETCNGKDDDCDKLVDNLPGPCGSSEGPCKPGRRVCVSGAEECIGATGPGLEVCDGMDNDCNGMVDEGFRDQLGQPCAEATGECRRPGVLVCAPNTLGVRCNAPQVTGEPERCNGLDDDCNGLIDDGPSGRCDAGPSCAGPARPETCNGMDDDCNGAIDDLPGSCGSATGTCRPGRRVCIDGKETCAGAVSPALELCVFGYLAGFLRI